jgi:DNA-binding GntR family transcriptional regulator
LAQEGFVQPIPRFGYLVSEITISDIHEIFELRSIVETAAARLAAVRASDEELDGILQSSNFTYVYRNRETYTEFLTLNAEFHRSIAVLTGNQRLVDLTQRNLDELNRVFHLGLDLRDSADEMPREHLALAESLLTRNAAGAAQIVGDQIENSRRRVLEALITRSARRESQSLSEVIQLKPST